MVGLSAEWHVLCIMVLWKICVLYRRKGVARAHGNFDWFDAGRLKDIWRVSALFRLDVEIWWPLLCFRRRFLIIGGMRMTDDVGG